MKTLSLRAAFIVTAVAAVIFINCALADVVTIKAEGDATADSSTGEKGVVLVARSGGDNSADLAVSYKTAGSAQNGSDYSMLSGTVTIPAGKGAAKIKVKAVSNPFSSGQETAVLKLKDSADGSYSVGASAKAKITVINPSNIIVLP